MVMPAYMYIPIDMFMTYTIQLQICASPNAFYLVVGVIISNNSGFFAQYLRHPLSHNTRIYRQVEFVKMLRMGPLSVTVSMLVVITMAYVGKNHSLAVLFQQDQDPIDNAVLYSI